MPTRSVQHADIQHGWCLLKRVCQHNYMTKSIATLMPTSTGQQVASMPDVNEHDVLCASTC
eukprot:4471581-Lingulodinium_polyedra.AAC.1